jgi:hypothetical protein
MCTLCWNEVDIQDKGKLFKPIFLYKHSDHVVGGYLNIINHQRVECFLQKATKIPPLLKLILEMFTYIYKKKK